MCNSTDELISVLGELDKDARDVLNAIGEDIWLNSNPPYFESENEIPVANYTGENISKKELKTYSFQLHTKIKIATLILIDFILKKN